MEMEKSPYWAVNRVNIPMFAVNSKSLVDERRKTAGCRRRMTRFFSVRIADRFMYSGVQG